MDEGEIRVLIAEDDSFQRLALEDILMTMDYTVVACPDGQAAWEALNSSTLGFNFAVLDIMMPEMDGLELLTRMKGSQNPKIKNLPVFMMSSAEDMSSVTACIQIGAVNFIQKPVSYIKAKNIATQAARKAEEQAQEEIIEDQVILQGLNNYTRERIIGRGAAGEVSLVKHKVSGQQFALKQVQLCHLTEGERMAAENEVTLLRVLVGPTIIRYYDHFTEEDSLYIVMEFAASGAVDEVVKAHKASGQKFSTDQIYKWTAQIVCALLIMHGKKILHRDLKIQNMFLSADNVIKLGDFGIAKALGTASDMARTSCGTPYFMAPEVCNGEQYGQKADAWSLGCAIYELITLNKPFSGENITQVFDSIKNKEYDPLPSDTDTGLILLISRLLNKNPTNRPSIFEIAVDPAIRRYINAFVEEEECFEEVGAALEHADKQTYSSTQGSQSVSITELYKIIRPNIELQDLSGGWFGKPQSRVFRGDQLIKAIVSINYTEEQARAYADELLDQEIMTNIKQPGFGLDQYFRFREDRTDIARNTVHSWSKEVRMVPAIVQGLIQIANDISNTFGDNTQQARTSNQFDSFLLAIAELQRVEIRSLQKMDKIAFFLNIYQVMLFHLMIEMPSIEKGWFSDSSDSFYYCLGGINFTLKEIKHGILRANKKAPENYRATLGSKDPKISLIGGWTDPRILFVCADPPVSHFVITDFNNRVEELLIELTKAYCNRNVCLDRSMGELTLPSIFKDYASDFGSDTAEILRYIWQYCSACRVSVDDVLGEIESGTILINYRE